MEVSASVNTRYRSITLVLWTLVFVGAIAALVSASHRWGVERDNRRVEIAVDLAELRLIAASEPQTPFAEVLTQFKAAGASSVTVEQDTIGGLEQSHRLNVLPSPDRATTTLQPLTADAYNRVAVALQSTTNFAVEAVPDPNAPASATTRRHRVRHAPTGQATPTPLPGGGPAPGLIVVHQPINVVRAVGVGIDPVTSQLVRDAGLSVVGRVGTFPGLTPAGIDWTIDRLHDAGATTALFTGEEVLGYNGPLPPGKPAPNLDRVADDLLRDGIHYGTVEFGKQFGDPAMQHRTTANLVRVHTVLGTEMATADMPSNIQRFLLAARERNIRLLFVRLFLSEPSPVEANVAYIQEIARGLINARPTHLTLGLAHGYAPLQTVRITRGLIGIGVAAAWLLLFDSVTRVFAHSRVRTAIIGPGLIALALVGLAVVGKSPSFMGVRIVALAAGCIYPALALLHKDSLRSESGSGMSPLLVAVVRFTMAVAITALGILSIVGLLADRLFLVKADDFLGVKPVSIIPALTVAVICGFSLRATNRCTFAQSVRKAADNIQRLFSEPLNLGQVAIALIATFVVLLVVTRSGNDSAVGVSQVELKLRSLLDLLMPARPRFKDMIGHPALLVAFTLAARGYRKWAFPFLLIGAIGLSSMLDAFCHLHTPLVVALTRDLIAIVIGLLIFFAILYPLFLRPLLRRLSPAPAVIE